MQVLLPLSPEGKGLKPLTHQFLESYELKSCYSCTQFTVKVVCSQLFKSAGQFYIAATRWQSLHIALTEIGFTDIFISLKCKKGNFL